MQIGSKTKGIALSAGETPGTFRVQRLEAESKQDGRTGDVITRIAFVPKKLDIEMRLRFEIA